MTDTKSVCPAEERKEETTIVTVPDGETIGNPEARTVLARTILKPEIQDHLLRRRKMTIGTDPGPDPNPEERKIESDQSLERIEKCVEPGAEVGEPGAEVGAGEKKGQKDRGVDREVRKDPIDREVLREIIKDPKGREADLKEGQGAKGREANQRAGPRRSQRRSEDLGLDPGPPRLTPGNPGQVRQRRSQEAGRRERRGRGLRARQGDPGSFLE